MRRQWVVLESCGVKLVFGGCLTPPNKNRPCSPCLFYYDTRRICKFGLQLAEEKTRLIPFGRFAQKRVEPYRKRPDTFVFLGFKHVCGQDKDGKFALIRIPSQKSCRKYLDRTHEWLAKHRHWKRRDQQRQLTQMLNDFYEYFGLSHSKPKLDWIRVEVTKQWIRCLRRQSQRHRMYWSYLRSREWFKLPYATVRHPLI